ncbi:2-Cys peroxiredoxin BAS1-like [Nymphaea thermarum]|nr:2-Cys peroxiredoxin BAS1-like [Nymphaea thermarum]
MFSDNFNFRWGGERRKRSGRRLPNEPEVAAESSTELDAAQTLVDFARLALMESRAVECQLGVEMTWGRRGCRTAGIHIILKDSSIHFAEITAFSDRYSEFEKLNTEVLGVSVDSVKLCDCEKKMVCQAASPRRYYQEVDEITGTPHGEAVDREPMAYWTSTWFHSEATQAL